MELAGWAFFLKDKKVAQCQLSMSLGLNEACDKLVAAWAGATWELQVLCLPPSVFKASSSVFSLETSITMSALYRGSPSNEGGGCKIT